MGKRSAAVATFVQALRLTGLQLAIIAVVMAGSFGASTIAVRAQDDTPEVTPKPAAKPATPKPPAATKSPAATPGKPATTPAAPTAQGAPATGPAAAAQQDPNQPILWVKLCSKDPSVPDAKPICLTAYELRDDKGQPVASVALREIEGDPKKTLLVAVPPLMLIQPGLRVSVDKGKQEEGKYTICFPNACYAEVSASDALIQQMKKGTLLYVVTLNTQGKPITLPFRLFGFKEKNEGPGIDPTQANKQATEQQQQQQQQVQDQLQKRADEAAKALGSKPAPDAPATPATPAPKP